MSDRVAYVSGNTRNRDHLPGFTLLRSEILQYVDASAVTFQDQIWPVDITLAQAMAIAWRVKKWKLTGTCAIATSATLPGPPGVASAVGSATIDADVVLMNADFIEATREREIVSGDMGAPWHALANSGANSIFGQPFSTWSTLRDGAIFNSGVRNTSGDTAFVLANRATLFDPGTGFFCPQFDGLGIIIGSTSPGASFASAFTQRHPVTSLSGSGATSLLAPGLLTVVPHIEASFDVPLQLGWKFDFQLAGSTFTGTGSLTMQLEAIEFWSFDGTYDTSNGNQLLDPFR